MLFKSISLKITDFALLAVAFALGSPGCLLLLPGRVGLCVVVVLVML